MINFDYYTNENIIEHNSKWPYISDHPYGILIVGGSESGETNSWVEINDESREAYNANSQIKFKNTMLKSSLCDYSDAYILAKGTISVKTLLLQVLLQIILIKKLYLETVLHLLIV